MPQVRLAQLSDLQPGTGFRVELGPDTAVALFRTDPGDGAPVVYALTDRCSHEDEPLHDGWLEEGQVECAAHGSCFDLATGEAMTAPAVEPVQAFPVTVRDGEVLVDVPVEWAPAAGSG